MDRIFEAYNGNMGAEFMHKTRERLHWICSQVWGSRVLDVGCSHGVVPVVLARMGYAVDGIDINPEAIAFANEQLAKEPADVKAKVTYSVGDFGKFVLPNDRKYDVITMSEVLEHLIRPQDFVRKAFSILPEKGRFIVTVPFGINDDPDHRQTFYLTSIYSLLHPLFEVAAVRIFNGWIGLVGRRRAEETKEPPVIPLNLMRQAEEAFFKIERPLRDGTLAVKNQRLELKAKQEKLAEDLHAAEQARMEAEARVAAAEATPLRLELEDVRGQLSASEGERQTLQTSLEVERKASSGLQDQVAMLKAMLQFATSRQQDNSQETRLLEYSQEVRDLRSALDQKRDEAISRAEQYGRLVGRVEYLESSNKHLLAGQQAAEEKVAELESAVAAAKDVAASEQAQREKLAADMSDANRQVEAQAAHIAELEVAHERAASERDSALAECEDERKKLAALQSETEIRIAELSSVCEASKKQVAELESAVAAAKDAAASEQAQREKLAADMLDANRQAEAQTTRIKALESELAELAKKLQGNSAILAKERQAAMDERNALRARLEAEVAWSVQHRRESEAEYERVLKEADAAQAKFKAATVAQSKLEDAQAKLQRQNEVIQRRLEAKTRAYDKLAAAKLGRLTLAYWRLKDGWRKPRNAGEGK